MPDTINIQGVGPVRVSPNFFDLPLEQQNATVDEIFGQLRSKPAAAAAAAGGGAAPGVGPAAGTAGGLMSAAPTPAGQPASFDERYNAIYAPQPTAEPAPVPQALGRPPEVPRQPDTTVPTEPPQPLRTGIIERAVEGAKTGFGDAPIGISPETRAKYPGIAALQPYAGAQDLVVRGLDAL